MYMWDLFSILSIVFSIVVCLISLEKAQEFFLIQKQAWTLSFTLT